MRQIGQQDQRSHSFHNFWLAGVAAVGLTACSDPAPQPRVDRIDVASPVGAILAQGRSHQFTATARDASGQTLSAVFSWASSNPVAAGVGGSGMVSALAAGETNINATIAAEPGVNGTLAIRIVNADLAAVATIHDDAFAGALISALSTGARPATQASWNACGAHAADGNVSAIQRCVTDLQTQAGAATDASDRALLAVVGIFGNHIERRLAL